MRVCECAGQRKLDSSYQLLHCIFHFSHSFQQQLQKKSEKLGISGQLIAPHISKKPAVLHQEINASDFWDLLPDAMPDPNISPHPNIPPQPNTRRIYSDYQPPWHVLCTGMRCSKAGCLSQELKLYQCVRCVIFCLTWGEIHSWEPAGKRWTSASRLLVQVLWGQLHCSQSCKSRTANRDSYKCPG